MPTALRAPTPTLGQLIGEAFQYWRDHQRSFWLVAGPCAVLFTAIKIAVLAGIINASGVSVAIAGAYIVTLDYWLKIMLFDDWKQRSKILAANKATRRSTWASWSFIGFCAGYALVTSIVASLVFFLVTPGVSGTFDDFSLVISTVGQVIVMLVAAAAFGSLLLFLPGRAVGLAWNVGDGFREAEGIHGLLIALAVCATLLSLIGPVVLAALGVLVSPGWLLALGHVLVVLVDFLALYVLAYGLSRAFLAKTGWLPQPLPQP